MRLTILITLLSSTCLALPARSSSEAKQCGRVHLEGGPTYMPMWSRETCVNSPGVIDHYINEKCSYCIMWEDNNCSGKVTSSGGPSMPYLVKDSRSWYCIE